MITFEIGANAFADRGEPSRLRVNPSKIGVNRNHGIGARPGTEGEGAGPVGGDFHGEYYHTGMLVVKEFL